MTDLDFWYFYDYSVNQCHNCSVEWFNSIDWNVEQIVEFQVAAHSFNSSGIDFAFILSFIVSRIKTEKNCLRIGTLWHITTTPT